MILVYTACPVLGLQGLLAQSCLSVVKHNPTLAKNLILQLDLTSDTKNAQVSKDVCPLYIFFLLKKGSLNCCLLIFS